MLHVAAALLLVGQGGSVASTVPLELSTWMVKVSYALPVGSSELM